MSAIDATSAIDAANKPPPRPDASSPQDAMTMPRDGSSRDASRDATSRVPPDAASDAATDGATPICEETAAFCAGSCVDLSSDDAHCGYCDHACGANRSCYGGQCECDLPLTLCSSQCVNPANDEAHCGGCGKVCAAQSTCINRACVCDASVPTLCDGTCVDMTSDEQHCGACEKTCRENSTCTSSDCVCDAKVPNLCGDTCVDFATDEANCGKCDHMCPATAQCTNGECKCKTAGLSPCGDACVDLQSDATHCGRCDLACPASGAMCKTGGCACDDTSLSVCGTACVNLTTDVGNCASCTRSCGASATCSGSACLPNDARDNFGCTNHRYGGHDYLVCTTTRSWTAARAKCQEWGQDLAVIDDGAENATLQALGNARSPGATYWMGANDRGSADTFSCNGNNEGRWEWISFGAGDDGTDFCTGNNPCLANNNAYVNFGSGEPNNSGCGCCTYEGQDCGSLRSGDGTWDDAGCGTTYPFICEDNQ